MTEIRDLLGDARLITCIVPKGRAREIERSLIEEKGIHTVNFHYGRGVGRFSPLSSRGVGEQLEKEILEVAVPADQADEVFEHIFFSGDMNKPHGGIIYMTKLSLATRMTMPELPTEK